MQSSSHWVKKKINFLHISSSFLGCLGLQPSMQHFTHFQRVIDLSVPLTFFSPPGLKFHGADKKFWKYLSDDKTHFSYLKQNSVGIYFVSLENSLRHYVLMYWLTSIFESPLGKETQAESQCFLSPFCYMVRNKWSHFASEKDIIDESNLRYHQIKLTYFIVEKSKA